MIPISRRETRQECVEAIKKDYGKASCGKEEGSAQNWLSFLVGLLGNGWPGTQSPPKPPKLPPPPGKKRKKKRKQKKRLGLLGFGFHFPWAPFGSRRSEVSVAGGHLGALLGQRPGGDQAVAGDQPQGAEAESRKAP